MKCPACGAEASGKFCSSCGSRLAPAACPACGEVSPPGAKFCIHCGAQLAASRGTAGQAGGSGWMGEKIAWWVAGLLLVGLIVVIGYPVIRDRLASPGAVTPPAGTAPGGAAAVDLSSMTPREAADRLFGRVMVAASQGDTAEALRFLPMALSAYDQIGSLDLDGRFHVALLQSTGGEYASSLATAREALAEDPDHLLNLSVAGAAAAASGDSAAAREYYGHFLEVYEAEMAKNREEYQAHQNFFPQARQDAEAFLAVGR